MFSAILRESDPDKRTTPIPARPGGVEIATIVSFKCKTKLRTSGDARRGGTELTAEWKEPACLRGKPPPGGADPCLRFHF
jgi:hypothetical protein